MPSSQAKTARCVPPPAPHPPVESTVLSLSPQVLAETRVGIGFITKPVRSKPARLLIYRISRAGVQSITCI